MLRPSGTYKCLRDGTVISGPLAASWLDFKTDTVEVMLLEGGGVGVVFDPDAPEGDPRCSEHDPRRP